MEGYRICRLYRDVRALSIFAGTSEIMKLIISRNLGLSPSKQCCVFTRRAGQERRSMIGFKDSLGIVFHLKLMVFHFILFFLVSPVFVNHFCVCLLFRFNLGAKNMRKTVSQSPLFQG